MNSMNPSASPHASPQHHATSSGASPAPLDLEQAHARIAEYERHRLQLEAQLAQAQRASLASVSLSPRSNANGTGRPRGPTAPEFSGAHIKGFEIDGWVREMQKQFAFYDPSVFPSDASKVRHASFFLKGAAAEWWETVNKYDANGVDITADWDAFVARLRERYRPLQASAIARQRIDALRQKGSVSAYCDMFQKELTPITTMSAEDQIFFFVKGLSSQAVQTKVREKDPSTLHEAMDIAVRAEVYQGKGQVAFGYRSFGSSSHGSTPMDVNAIDGVEAEELAAEPANREMSQQQLLAAMEKMFIAALNQKPKGSSASSSAGSGGRRTDKIPGLKFEKGEIDALRRENRCFKCKEVGHMKGECKNAVKLNW